MPSNRNRPRSGKDLSDVANLQDLGQLEDLIDQEGDVADGFVWDCEECGARSRADALDMLSFRK